MASDRTFVEYRLVAPCTLEPGTRTLAELPPNWVRLRYLYCGICGSDMSMFESLRSVEYPRSLGHEFVAEVVEAGSAVARLRAGDVVTSDLNFRCGQCDHCANGRSHLCRTGQLGYFSNRAFAEYGDIEESYLTLVDGPPAKHLALAEPLSCVLHAIDGIAPTAEERILVVGAGGIGTCMAFALSNHHSGLRFDIAELIPSRLAKIGRACQPSGTAVSSPLGEYDVVFDVSGSESGLALALSGVTSGGRLCSMSHLYGEPPAPFLYQDLIRRDITFKLSYLNGDRSNVERAARMLRDSWNECWDDTIELVPLNAVAEAFSRRRTSPWCKTIVQVPRVPDR